MVLDDEELKSFDSKLFRKANILFNEGEESIIWKDYNDACNLFDMSFAQLPEPKTRWAASLQILAAKGDTCFLNKDFTQGVTVFSEAMKYGDGHENPFLHLRLGQCLYETGDKERALQEITLAYIAERENIFAQDDKKYIEFIKKYLREPES